MNTPAILMLTLSAAESGEVHVTTFAAVLVILTLGLLLSVSFYTLQLVLNLKRELARKPVSLPAPRVEEKPRLEPVTMTPAPVPEPIASAVSPQLFAVIAAAIHVSFARPARIVTVTAETTEFLELQAWGHAGRLHLHDHRLT